MRNTLGLIMSFDNDTDMRELTEHRPISSIPFSGRYRVIDFMLSNFVNSGCNQVGIHPFCKPLPNRRLHAVQYGEQWH